MTNVWWSFRSSSAPLEIRATSLHSRIIIVSHPSWRNSPRRRRTRTSTWLVNASLSLLSSLQLESRICVMPLATFRSGCVARASNPRATDAKTILLLFSKGRPRCDGRGAKQRQRTFRSPRGCARVSCVMGWGDILHEGYNHHLVTIMS